jgi:hypothetical protein
MPYCSNAKTTYLEWHQWPAVDLSIHHAAFDGKTGNVGDATSELKVGVVDAQSLQGARAVSRTLLQCLRQVEKIEDGSSTQELQASVLADSSYSSIMAGNIPRSCRRCMRQISRVHTPQSAALATAAAAPPSDAAVSDVALTHASCLNAQEQVTAPFIPISIAFSLITSSLCTAEHPCGTPSSLNVARRRH